MNMTSEQIRLNGLAMVAHSEGKPVERRKIVGIAEQWKVSPSPVWDFDEFEYRPKPWSLPDPPKGHRWHRDDFIESDLPDGYRPLLEQEMDRRLHRDIQIKLHESGEWDTIRDDGVYAVPFINQWFRTKRQLPTGPRVRDWCKPEDVPLNCWLRRPNSQICRLVTQVDVSGVCVNDYEFSWSEITEAHMEYSTDRRTWQRCEVAE
jgi:hypothetical protein